MGADLVVNYKSESYSEQLLAEKIMATTDGKGVDIV